MGRRRLARWWIVVTMGVIGAVLLVGVAYWHEGRNPRSRWMGHVVSRGTGRAKVVALTFNGGPNLDWTQRISARLVAEHIVGTFFVAGENVRGHANIVRSLLAQHQLVGNLGTSVAGDRWWSPGWDDARATQQLLGDGAKVCPTFFRPAHGRHTPFMIRRVEHLGMAAITYDVEAQDWLPMSPNELADTVLQRVAPGSIVMFHDGLGRNLHRNRALLDQTLPIVIARLRAQHYTIVGLDKLLDRRPTQPLASCT